MHHGQVNLSVPPIKEPVQAYHGQVELVRATGEMSLFRILAKSELVARTNLFVRDRQGQSPRHHGQAELVRATKASLFVKWE